MSRPFVEVLSDLEGGRLLEDLNSGLTELVSQVMAIRKGGTMTLKIGVLPNGETSVEVRAKMDVNAPEPARESTIMFADDASGLRRENPRQMKLPLREVQQPETRVIAEATTVRTV
jgi:hypothetical protein